MLTGLIGELLALTLLGLLGTLFLAKDTDLDLCDGGLVADLVWLWALRGGERQWCLGSGTIHGLAGL